MLLDEERKDIQPRLSRPRRTLPPFPRDRQVVLDLCPAFRPLSRRAPVSPVNLAPETTPPDLTT